MFNPVSQSLTGNPQVIAQSHLDQPNQQNAAQDTEVASDLHDQAKAAFQNIANAHRLCPSVFEHAKLLEALGKHDKAQALSYEPIKPASIPPAMLLSVSGAPMLSQTASSTQEKSELVDYLFEKALLTLGSLAVSHKPSLFLVYAHDNENLKQGKADADTAKYFIKELSTVRTNLYSDQTPMGQPYLSSPEDLKEDGKLEDILTSQLCLLPTKLRDDVAPVDKVIVCCSELLGNYLKWESYPDFYEKLKEAYEEDRKAPGDPKHIRKVIHAFSSKAAFHHVLTEIAFLQIRVEQLEDQHGIIPVALTRNSYDHCLAHFIAATSQCLRQPERAAG